MKPVKIRSNYTPRPSRNQKTKQLVFFAAFLFLLAAIITIYVAWEDLRGVGNTELLV
ncbi:hypothetical protein ACP8HI_12230 [Paenibacillus sp. FA6]|uniref:hypothetical protein n=1 Tax=Paenibacillus sp. FA6 TaxID=3413029 RepID=UPI003F65B84D